MHKTGIIFDFDEFLVDTHAMWLKANEQTLAQHGKTLTEERFWELDGGCDIQAYTVALELDVALAPQIQTERNRIYDLLLKEATLLPGAQELMQEVHDRSIPKGLVTHAQRQNIEAVAHLGLLDFFPHMLCQSDLGNKRKPHPYGLLKMAELLGVDPARSMYWGDRLKDKQAADAAGMKCVIVPSKRTEREAMRTAWRVFENLHECREHLDALLLDIQS